ncbi:MAG: hypothetical protein ACW99G_17675 [Candidatus Thorarchaeota archaeon]
MGTKENKIVALILVLGSLMLVMGIFVGVSSSDPVAQKFEVLQERPPGGKPTDRTDRPTGSPPIRTPTNQVISGGDYFTFIPSSLLLGGFVVLAFVVVFALKQYNNINIGDTTRSDVLSEIYCLDDEVEDESNRNEESLTATERAYKEAHELASYDEWDRIFDSIEKHLIESVDYKTNMTSLVRIILPLRDSGDIGLSRRKITLAMWLIVKLDLLERNQEGEITLDKDYENKVSYFLNEMEENPSREEKIEEANLDESDDK